MIISEPLWNIDKFQPLGAVDLNRGLQKLLFCWIGTLLKRAFHIAKLKCILLPRKLLTSAKLISIFSAVRPQ